MAEPALLLPRDRAISLEVTPLGTPLPLLGRVRGMCAAESTPQTTTALYSGYLRPESSARADVCSSDLSAQDLIDLELQLRSAAHSGSDRVLLGLFAQPAMENSSGVLNTLPFGIGAAGVYQ